MAARESLCWLASTTRYATDPVHARWLRDRPRRVPELRRSRSSLPAHLRWSGRRGPRLRGLRPVRLHERGRRAAHGRAEDQADRRPSRTGHGHGPATLSSPGDRRRRRHAPPPASFGDRQLSPVDLPGAFPCFSPRGSTDSGAAGKRMDRPCGLPAASLSSPPAYRGSRAGGLSVPRPLSASLRAMPRSPRPRARTRRATR